MLRRKSKWLIYANARTAAGAQYSDLTALDAEVRCNDHSCRDDSLEGAPKEVQIGG